MHASHPPSAARPLLALLAVCLAALAMPLSFTGPAVALHALRDALGGSPVQMNWVTNAFMLAFGAALMPAGALADAWGRRRLFLGGTLVFGAASLALTLSPGIAWFDVGRALQGLGAAAAFSGGAAALAQAFDGAERTRAFGLLGTTFGIGLAAGPLLAGVLADTIGWQGVLLLPMVLATAAALLGVWQLDESRDPAATGVDWPGVSSFSGTLVLFTFGVLQAPASGWSDPLVLGALAGSVLLGTVFVRVESRALRPMFDLSLLRYPRFVGVQLLAAAPAYSFVVLLVLLPIRFVGIEGRSASEAGWLMAALSAPLVVVPLLAARLAQRIPARALCGAGLLLCAVALVWLGHCEPGRPGLEIIGPMLLIGVGIGLPWGLMDGLAVSVVPKERAGMAAGIFSTVRVAGEGVALAVVGAALAGLLQHSLHAAVGADQLSLAAQRVATGELAQALPLLPGLDRPSLVAGYGAAFRALSWSLAAITLVSAAAVYAFLQPHGEAPPDAAAGDATADRQAA